MNNRVDERTESKGNVLGSQQQGPCIHGKTLESDHFFYFIQTPKVKKIIDQFRKIACVATIERCALYTSSAITLPDKHWNANGSIRSIAQCQGMRWRKDSITCIHELNQQNACCPISSCSG